MARQSASSQMERPPCCSRSREPPSTRYWVAFGLGSPRRRSLFIAAGMLAPQAMRLLRLWALWGKLPRGSSRQAAPGPG